MATIEAIAGTPAALLALNETKAVRQCQVLVPKDWSGRVKVQL
jgi:hypothetical protein